MAPLLLVLLALILVAVGYWITARVPDEIPAATKPVLAVYVILTLLLVAYYGWWQAALLIGALLIGWLFSALALAILITSPGTNLGLLYITLSLALLMGARYRFEEQNRLTLAIGILVSTLLVIGVRILVA